MQTKGRRLDTTLGELIAAASEVAFEYSHNDKEAYEVARLALIEILKKASYQSALADYMESAPGQQFLH